MLPLVLPVGLPSVASSTKFFWQLWLMGVVTVSCTVTVRASKLFRLWQVLVLFGSGKSLQLQETLGVVRLTNRVQRMSNMPLIVDRT